MNRLRVIVWAFLAMLLPCSAVQLVDTNSLVSLPTSANYRLWVGNAPADNAVVTLNPPIFKCIYASNVVKMAYPDATLQTFRLQISTNNFTTTNVDIVTSNNFYNCLSPLTNSDGSSYLGTTVVRVGYMNSNASPSSLLWGSTNHYTVASGAVQWDRGQYADTNYLIQLGIQHPHMFFTAANRAAMATFLHTNSAMGFSWNQLTNIAYQTTTNSWWNDASFTNQEPANWAQNISKVCLAYQIDSNAFWKGVNPGKMVSLLASNFIAKGEDQLDPNQISEAVKEIPLCYDWAYTDMDAVQKSNVLWTMERCALFYVYNDWWYVGTPLTDRNYTNARVINYDSLAKAGSSHARVDSGLGLYMTWGGMGESAVLRDCQTYFLNYCIGQVDPFDGDEGRGYAEQSWRTLHNFAAQLLLACNDARMTNNPWFTKYPKMFCYWEPLNYAEIQSQWGDFGLHLQNHVADTYQFNYKYYDLAIMYQNGAILQQHQLNYPIRSGTADFYPEYGEAFLPFYFPTVPATNDWPDTYYFDEQDGWAMSYTYPPNNNNCFTNGVGIVYSARPKGGRNEHDTWHDGDFQMFAYGAEVTYGGVGQYYKNAMFYPGLFVDGIGNCTPNGQPPTTNWYSRITTFTNSSAFTFIGSELGQAYNNWNTNAFAGGGNGNLEQFYNNSTNARPYIVSVQRNTLFPHKRYAVLYDTFTTTTPATFQWHWPIVETNNLSIDAANMKFSYTSTNFYNGSNVTTYVQHIVSPSTMSVTNLTGTNSILVNPFTGEDLTSITNGGIGPCGNASLWIYNKTKATTWHFLSVIYPAKWGEAAPTITRIDDNTFSIVSADGSINETNTFDPNYAGAATIKVSLGSSSPSTPLVQLFFPARKF